jgi:hypothetical protein
MTNATASSLALKKDGGNPNGLHPAWQAFVRFCSELGYGEIEQLKIQDGLPLLAEVTRKKVKFES